MLSARQSISHVELYQMFLIYLMNINEPNQLKFYGVLGSDVRLTVKSVRFRFQKINRTSGF